MLINNWRGYAQHGLGVDFARIHVIKWDTLPRDDERLFGRGDVERVDGPDVFRVQVLLCDRDARWCALRVACGLERLSSQKKRCAKTLKNPYRICVYINNLRDMRETHVRSAHTHATELKMRTGGRGYALPRTMRTGSQQRSSLSGLLSLSTLMFPLVDTPTTVTLCSASQRKTNGSTTSWVSSSSSSKSSRIVVFGCLLIGLKGEHPSKLLVC